MIIEILLHPEIEKFIESLVNCNLLLTFGEGVVIAKNANRYRPDYEFMADIIATRAAHKKFGPEKG
jgi:hypothetical protein